MSDEGKRTILSLYRQDVRSVVEAVLLRQNLFDNAPPLAKGLVRFDTHISILKSDRPTVLDVAISTETALVSSDGGGDLINTLIVFKEETRALLCPKIKDILKNSSPHIAVSVFNDVVNYVETSFLTYKRTGDLPGTEFRNLLADINIKITEDILMSRNDAPDNNNNHHLSFLRPPPTSRSSSSSPVDNYK